MHALSARIAGRRRLRRPGTGPARPRVLAARSVAARFLSARYPAARRVRARPDRRPLRRVPYLVVEADLDAGLGEPVRAERVRGGLGEFERELGRVREPGGRVLGQRLHDYRADGGGYAVQWRWRHVEVMIDQRAHGQGPTEKWSTGQ